MLEIKKGREKKNKQKLRKNGSVSKKKNGRMARMRMVAQNYMMKIYQLDRNKLKTRTTKQRRDNLLFSSSRYSEWCGGVSLCVGIIPQIRYVDILILLLNYHSNIVHNSEGKSEFFYKCPVFAMSS